MKKSFCVKILSLLAVVMLIPNAVLCADISYDNPPEYVEWLLETARNEIGYQEEKSGYSKYGAWSGDPYAQWCAEFVCWCVNKVDDVHGTKLLGNVYPLYSGSNTGKNWFIRHGRYISKNGRIEGWGSQWIKDTDIFCSMLDYFPQPGDLAFFTWDGDEDTDHVAIVEYSEYDQSGEILVHVIEGNNPDSVARNEYLLTDRSILGIGTTRDCFDVTIRSGCIGSKVTGLQQKLIFLGLLDESLCDGVCGGKTVAAIQAVQQRLGLRTTGIADMTTQNAIKQLAEKKYVTDSQNWSVSDDE